MLVADEDGGPVRSASCPGVVTPDESAVKRRTICSSKPTTRLTCTTSGFVSSHSMSAPAVQPSAGKPCSTTAAVTSSSVTPVARMPTASRRRLAWRSGVALPVGEPGALEGLGGLVGEAPVLLLDLVGPTS